MIAVRNYGNGINKYRQNNRWHKIDSGIGLHLH